MAVTPARLRARLRRLRILIMDVDGVLTDAGMYFVS
jgi:3-deoxy-D-manno-octulosonate 8-phosphate phosphatase KdsC-like HAD superfamily phosphatase